MSPDPPPRARKIVVAVLTPPATPLALSAAGVAQADPRSTNETVGTYIVELASNPVAGYDGGIAGLARTRPDTGQRLDAHSAQSQSYASHLARQRADVLAKVPGARKVYDYTYTFAGFSARMTSRDAARMAAQPGVRSVVKDGVGQLDTISTPEFLGLTGSAGAWTQQFGDPKRAGEGIIVGMIDSGIWADNPSFAALPTPRPDQAAIDAKWKGVCVTGDGTGKIACNNKLIGARWYNAGIPAIPDEFVSPRDWTGHGSHTSSTVAGNYGVTAVINGQPVGTASGMAPAARLAMYKVCWAIDHVGGNSCANSDSVKAIDQAVADGVDVLNFSISGARDSVSAPVEAAFFNAAAAGVFVAASAGNSGPTASTVAHNGPWITTVAASTHDRGFKATVTLGNGKTFDGAGLGAAVPNTPLVDSTQAGLAGADPTQLRLCYPGTLDAAKVGGKIVVCTRGVIDRTAKSKSVKDAGGVGMILVNASPSTTAADFHFVPTIHLDAAPGAEVRAYALAGGGTAALGAGVRVKAQAPAMADFSSTGPALAGRGDLLKPDITAPGVDVIAAVAPPGNNGNDFSSFQGTSMSSPHIAGIGALIMAKHPDWSPAKVKSALMTTASTVDNAGVPIKRGTADATPLDYGNGHVQPARAFDPGLVYDSDWRDWLRYTCGIGESIMVDNADVCGVVGKIDGSQLNYPSIASGDLTGTQTFDRKVTNVTRRVGIYHGTVQAPKGFTAKVSPEWLFVRPGHTAKFTVTLTRTDAPYGAYTFGALNWTELFGKRTVRSSIAVRPMPVEAPLSATGTGVSGSMDLKVRTGYDGKLVAGLQGLVAPQVKESVPLKPNPAQRFDPAKPTETDHTAKQVVTVPAGTPLAKFALFARDYPVGTDLDMFVYRVSDDGLTRTLVGQSDGGTAEENVTLRAPQAGTYEVYTELFSLADGQTQVVVRNQTWLVPTNATGIGKVSPAEQRARFNRTETVKLSWTGLATGTLYLGFVAYGDGTTPVGITEVTVQS